MPELAINPKSQFQKYHPAERDEWQKICRARATQLTMTYALSEMANLGFPETQIAGARTFMFLLLNMGEAEGPTMQERYPAVPLQEEGAVSAALTEE